MSWIKQGLVVGVVAALGACTGLTVDPVGRPCDDNQPCGPGTACDPISGTCIQELNADAEVKDLPDLPDAAEGDAPLPDQSLPDLPLNDLPLNDLPLSDLPLVDTLQPDILLPDMYMPDLFSPDIFITPDAGCPTGLTKCGTACADLTSSFTHCGQCNAPCPSGSTNQCLGGQCVCGTTGGGCPAGLNCVGGACVCVLGGRCQGCCNSSVCVPLGSAQDTSTCGKNGETCKVCYDMNWCTLDSCTAAGDCLSTNRADGTQCSDGDDCTHSDACQGGVCQSTPFSCSDGIGCTSDICSGTPPPNNCSNPLQSGHCLIAGTCYHDGDSNPAGPPCQELCLVSQNTSAWTPFSGPCVATFAGDGDSSFGNGAALSASFDDPNGIALDSSGKIYVADRDNHRIRLIDGGMVSTFAGTGTQGYADGAALTTAQFDRPLGVAVDANGVVYVADEGNDMIRKIDSGTVTTFAGTGTAGFADGAAAAAQFDNPRDVAVGSGGVLYVADRSNNRIRMISGGQVTTFAGDGTAGLQDGAVAQAQFNSPRSVAVDSSGAVYVADRSNYRIRKIAGGQVTTIAGSGTTPGFQDGPAATSQLIGPYGVAVDSSGTVYFSDTGFGGDARIRTISSGTVSTMAGSGNTGFQDGPAAQAEFDSPRHLVVDSSGKVYVADEDNHRIRVIIP